jgi:glycosyltransferase involved in cell wall biosynthesis
VSDRDDRLAARFEDVIAFLQAERAERQAAAARTDAQITELRELVAALARDDGHHRRALYALRASAEYEPAFSDPQPLVTIAITTLADRLELLTQRALPSALGQTYANVEILVVGDAAGDETRAAVEAVGDPRVRFVDLTQSYVDPDPRRRWLAGATLTRNEALHQARGHWIADLDDDDALRPGAVAGLLALARERRLEVVYGIKERHGPDGERVGLGAFPPAPVAPDPDGEPPWAHWEGAASCGALVHGGLRLFARDYVAGNVGQPGDFFRLERMVRAGVRFGMLDEVVYDYYPSTRWAR